MKKIKLKIIKQGKISTRIPGTLKNATLYFTIPFLMLKFYKGVHAAF